MKILIINAFGESKKAKRQFEAFYNMCMAAIQKYADGDDMIIDVRTPHTLDDYIYLPQEVYGITPQVKKAAKEVFLASDADNSGTIDADEMFTLVQMLFRRLGIPLRPDYLPLLKEEVTLALELYDDDGSGELEFDEFCSVLCKDPWRELLPTDSRKKEDANRSMHNFCMCDVILVDGDPHMLPWDKGSIDLLALVRQVMYAQEWPKPSCMQMLGSAIVTQMLQYLQLVGAKVLPIFNGNPPGVGTKGSMLDHIDISQEAPKVGGFFLDHSTGDTFKWNKKKYDDKFPRKAWELQVNVGMIMHAGRPAPPRKYDSSGEQTDSTKTLVKRETKEYQNWVFEGISSIQFLAPVHRNWDVQMRLEGKKLRLLASSMRGVEIVQDASSAIIGTMFSFHPVFKETEKIVYNFIKNKFHFLRVSEDSKNDWYMWMLSSASNGKLKFWFPPMFKNYRQPQGLQLKKRPKELSAAQKRMVENVGKVNPQAATKMVMDADGNLVEATGIVDPNKEKLAKAAANADAVADEEAANYEKANRWDSKRDAKTMHKLMSYNKARCMTTEDPATGVSTAAGDLGTDDNMFEKMKSGEEDDEPYKIDEPVSPTKDDERRPRTALGLRNNSWAPSPATKRTIRPIKRMQSAMSARLTPTESNVLKPPLDTKITRYELKVAEKHRKAGMARNMTPLGYRPDCKFEALMAKKEGASALMEDAFVPDPYVSDNDTYKRTLKTTEAKFLDGAFLTASGPRPVQKIEYGSTPYHIFSFRRPVHKDRWMRDKDFVKMGRTTQPFDGPLKEPKRPTRRSTSRA